VRLSTPRRAFLAQVFFGLNAFPDVFPETLQIQKAARRGGKFRPKTRDQFTDQARLVGRFKRRGILPRGFVRVKLIPELVVVGGNFAATAKSRDK
jgi:hypothetical protein